MIDKNIDTSVTKASNESRGILYIVATPIGNLGDITQRALDTLKSVDKICAEDTRNTRKLLTHFGIQSDLYAVHDHNEKNRIAQIKNWLDAGENIALVSDAGTPLISDPGYHLVQQLGDCNYLIQAIPGACAIISALSIAGLATDRFCFEGFLPAKSASRKKVLQTNIDEPRTHVYYESSHRIVNTVEAMLEIYGSTRKVVLARELTKLYEQVFRGSLEALNVWIQDDPMHQKGEFVLLVAGQANQTKKDKIESTSQAILKILLEDLPVKLASNLAAKITGRKKNELYRLAMDMKKKPAKSK